MCTTEKSFTTFWAWGSNFHYSLMYTLHHTWLFSFLILVKTLPILFKVPLLVKIDLYWFAIMPAFYAFVPLYLLTKIILCCSFLLHNTPFFKIQLKYPEFVKYSYLSSVQKHSFKELHMLLSTAVKMFAVISLSVTLNTWLWVYQGW